MVTGHSAAARAPAGRLLNHRDGLIGTLRPVLDEYSTWSVTPCQ